MNREAIAELQSASDYPSVSILLPTHRTAPDSEEDPIRLKNLVREAYSRLKEEFEEHEVRDILEEIDRRADEIDHRYNLRGLGIFVNHRVARTYQLPFHVEERVVIDETFATRDLVYALNRTPRYRVLVLGECPSRVFEGTRYGLQEVREHGFPMEHGGPGGGSKLRPGPRVNDAEYKDDRARQFFREVDAGLFELQKREALPVVLAGVDRDCTMFRNVSQNGDHLIGDVDGNYDESPAHEINDAAWPVVEAWLSKQRAEVLEELGTARGADKFAPGLSEAWRAAREGRVARVVVEENHEMPAVPDQTGMKLNPAKDATEPGVIDDAVDELIEATLQQGGEAWFVEEDALQEHGRVAAILRY